MFRVRSLININANFQMRFIIYIYLLPTLLNLITSDIKFSGLEAAVFCKEVFCESAVNAAAGAHFKEYDNNLKSLTTWHHAILL